MVMSERGRLNRKERRRQAEERENGTREREYEKASARESERYDTQERW